MNNANNIKLKIVHIISGDLWAGAEAMAFNLLSHLKAHSDLDLTVIILNEGKLSEKLKAIGITVHIIDESKLSFWQIVRKTRAILRTALPDLIHSHRYKENLLASLSTGFNDRIKLIATQHGLPELFETNGTLFNRLKTKANFQLLSHYFTRTVAVSADVKYALIAEHAFHQNQVESIHNGIEIPVAAVSKPKTNSFVIGSSGRLSPVKDYPLMVKIAAAVNTRNVPGVHFELAGEGPERTILESMLGSYALRNNFTMKGHQDDMNTFYSGIDLFLNTSIHEGIPMTILEALARGIPVVAPDVGGIREIITNGVEGFLINSRAPEVFAEKCLLLQENRELRETMSKAARDTAERTFSAERMSDKYYRLYHRTATQARPQQFTYADAFNLARQRLP